MDPSNPYDLAFSQHLARSLRLYGSSSSSTSPTTSFSAPSTTSSSTPPSTLLTTTSTMTLTSGINPYPADYPYFWPLVFKYFSNLLQSFYNTYIFPLLYNFLIPLFVVWTTYKLFVNFYPNGREIIFTNTIVLRIQRLQESPLQGLESVRRIRDAHFWNILSRISSRIGWFISDHWLALLFTTFLLYFMLRRVLFVEYPYDLRGKGFMIPEYMARERNEEGSNHVGWLDKDGEGWMGSKEWSTDFSTTGSVTAAAAAPSTMTTISTSSALLSQITTTSSAVESPAVSTESSSSIESTSSSSSSSPALEGAIPEPSQPDNESHASQGRIWGVYDEDGLAFCRKCRQKHCCEVF